MFSSTSKPVPQRTSSVNSVKHANFFGPVDEEMRDCKRVQSHGQEEDLREALGRMMARVEEMVRSDPALVLWDALTNLPVRDAQIVLSNECGSRDAAQSCPIESQARTGEHGDARRGAQKQLAFQGRRMAPCVARGCFSLIDVVAARLSLDTLLIATSISAHERRREPDSAGFPRLPELGPR